MHSGAMDEPPSPACTRLPLLRRDPLQLLRLGSGAEAGSAGRRRLSSLPLGEPEEAALVPVGPQPSQLIWFPFTCFKKLSPCCNSRPCPGRCMVWGGGERSAAPGRAGNARFGDGQGSPAAGGGLGRESLQRHGPPPLLLTRAALRGQALRLSCVPVPRRHGFANCAPCSALWSRHILPVPSAGRSGVAVPQGVK